MNGYKLGIQHQSPMAPKSYLMPSLLLFLSPLMFVFFLSMTSTWSVCAIILLWFLAVYFRDGINRNAVSIYDPYPHPVSGIRLGSVGSRHHPVGGGGERAGPERGGAGEEGGAGRGGIREVNTHTYTHIYTHTSPFPHSLPLHIPPLHTHTHTLIQIQANLYVILFQLLTWKESHEMDVLSICLCICICFP